MDHWYVEAKHPEIEAMLWTVARENGWACHDDDVPGWRCLTTASLTGIAGQLTGCRCPYAGCGEKVDINEAIKRLKAGPPKPEPEPPKPVDRLSLVVNEAISAIYTSGHKAAITHVGGRVVHLTEKPRVDDVDWREVAEAVYTEMRNCHPNKNSRREWDELLGSRQHAHITVLRAVIGRRFCQPEGGATS